MNWNHNDKYPSQNRTDKLSINVNKYQTFLLYPPTLFSKHPNGIPFCKASRDHCASSHSTETESGKVIP